MSADHTRSRTITDLAAGLTDPALEALAPALSGRDTVQLELSLWHALAGELEREGTGDIRQIVQRAVAALRLPDWPTGRSE